MLEAPKDVRVRARSGRSHLHLSDVLAPFNRCGGWR